MSTPRSGWAHHFRLPWLTHVHHYGGLQRTDKRLERLLREFRFTAIGNTVAELTDPVGWLDARERRAS